MRALSGVLLLCCALGLGCDASRLNGTALLVTTQGGLAPLTQLRYQASDTSGASALSPMLRPEAAGTTLSSTNVVRVLLPDTLAGQTLEVSVEGLVAGDAVVSGRALVHVEAGREVALTILLAPPSSGCAGCTGCCSPSGTCLSPTRTACGAAGLACASCEAATSDGCGADGRCACGVGPACAAGRQCQGGQCVAGCSATACPDGCCANGVCQARTLNSCGAAGRTCASCAPLVSDGCRADGSCGCGGGPACGTGQPCLAGACHCDPSTCEGCCSAAGECQTGTAKALCGAGGATCRACARKCRSGACE